MIRAPIGWQVVGFMKNFDTRSMGIGLIVYVFAVYALSLARLALGSGISGHAIWIALLLSIAVVVIVARRQGASPVLAGCAALSTTLLILAAIGVSAVVYDVSYDGISYHQEAVIQLAGGWNPVHEHLAQTVHHSLWLNHYPKLGWIFAASHDAAFGNIESGKCYSLILAAALALMLYGSLRRSAGLGWWSLIVTVLVVANPVVITQLFNYYVDGLIYLNFVLTCVIAFHAAREKTFGWYALLCVSSILLVNTKFTGVPYFVLISAFFATSVAVTRGFREACRFVSVAVASFAIAVLLFGFDSYVRNTIENGHPLYPLYGEGAVDIMSPEYPASLRDLGAPTRLAASLFSVVSNRMDGDLQLRMPFLPSSRAELSESAGYDIRFSGFGFWFSGILVAAIAALAYAILNRARRFPRSAALSVVAALLLTVLINPEAWWARYVPQLWLLPMIAVFLLRLVPTTFARGFAVFMVAIMLTNSAVILHGVLLSNYESTSLVRREMSSLSHATAPLSFHFGEFHALRVRLDRNKVPFLAVPQNEPLPCADARNLAASHGVQYCPDK